MKKLSSLLRTLLRPFLKKKLLSKILNNQKLRSLLRNQKKIKKYNLIRMINKMIFLKPLKRLSINPILINRFNKRIIHKLSLLKKAKLENKKLSRQMKMLLLKLPRKIRIILNLQMSIQTNILSIKKKRFNRLNRFSSQKKLIKSQKNKKRRLLTLLTMMMMDQSLRNLLSYIHLTIDGK